MLNTIPKSRRKRKKKKIKMVTKRKKKNLKTPSSKKSVYNYSKLRSLSTKPKMSLTSYGK